MIRDSSRPLIHIHIAVVAVVVVTPPIILRPTLRAFRHGVPPTHNVKPPRIHRHIPIPILPFLRMDIHPRGSHVCVPFLRRVDLRPVPIYIAIATTTTCRCGCACVELLTGHIHVRKRRFYSGGGGGGGGGRGSSLGAAAQVAVAGLSLGISSSGGSSSRRRRSTVPKPRTLNVAVLLALGISSADKLKAGGVHTHIASGGIVPHDRAWGLYTGDGGGGGVVDMHQFPLIPTVEAVGGDGAGAVCVVCVCVCVSMSVNVRI
jgi:hypothetical protein